MIKEQNKQIDYKIHIKPQNSWVLLNQRKYDRTMNLLEKQFDIMLLNCSRDRLISLLDFNIQYFENQLTLINTWITENKPEKQIEIKNVESSDSSSEYSSSQSSDNK